MTADELLAEISRRAIQLRRNGQELVLRGVDEALDSTFLDELRTHKASLLQLIDASEDLWWSPAISITPEMLPLIALRQEEIDRIVSTVPGGVRNIQDIYPLTPLQEGMLFHHLMGGKGDPYLGATLISFDSRTLLDRYIRAMQAVVDRHDILRTAVLWEDLPEPVQVVWRQAPLRVEEIELDPATGDIAEQMYARFNPSSFRLDVRGAPLFGLYIAHDSAEKRWLLMMLFHHLAGDNTSLATLIGEVNAYLRGQKATLPVPLPFRNLVAQTRLGTSREEHEAYFRKMLGDVDEPTAPFGLLEVKGDGSGIEQARVSLERDLVQRLRGHARRLGVSTASLCHLAWARVLAKMSGREDVVFGTVLSGRMQGWENSGRVMGLVINTLPMRLRVGEETVERAVRSTHSALADLMRHEHASLALAQRCSGVPAPLPLFSALFNYRHSVGATQEDPGQAAGHLWEGIRLLRSEEHTNYPLSLSVDDLEENISLDAQAPNSIGPLRICAYMSTALESLSKTLETSPSKAVSSIEVLPERERQQLLYEWNDTTAEFPSEQCVHELFEEQVERTPDAVAVVGEDQYLTYGELNRRSNQLAHYLRQIGVKTDMRVALCLDRGLEMIVALLGVLKAGGAYVPLDPEYPPERLRFMLQDSTPVALLTQTRMRGLVTGTEATLPLLELDGTLAPWEQLPRTNPDSHRIGVMPGHLAYVIYTSGSTGNPKGVAIEHGSLVNLIHWHVGASGLHCGQYSSSLAGVGFDAATWEIWPTLCVGATLRLCSSSRVTDPEALLGWWEGQKLDVSFLPTPIAEFAFSRGITNGYLHTLLVGGDHLRCLPLQAPPFRLINNYGPTETTVVATSGCIDLTAPVLSIGRPIANTQVYLLDKYGDPVPVGVTGELYVGGAGVARGYLNRPELTAEMFLTDPFSDKPHARMYRTGDLGRWLPDGNIEFLGRSDFQVKIRGFRIELGEIEARLAEYGAVGEAVVLAREDTQGDRRLVAYYTNSKEQDYVTAEQLRSHLVASLPAYMVPVAYVRLEAMPLTPNGKLDRKALPPLAGDVYAVQGYEAPRGEMEIKLAANWAEVLKLERVGRHDNFFSLGGHSLLATRLTSRIRSTFGVELAVRTLYEAPTVAGLAQRLPGAERARLPLRARSRPARIPLSYAQKRLWFLEQLEGGGGTYNLPIGLRLKGRLNRNALRQALGDLVGRHEILRTVFWEDNEGPWQKVLEEQQVGEFFFEREIGREELEGELKQAASYRFELQREIPLRVWLMRVEEEEHVLMLLLHHIATDGWSMVPMTRDLAAAYNARSQGVAPGWSALAVQYADYSLWQRERLGEESEGESILRGQLQYWKEKLAGLPGEMELPRDRGRGAVSSYRGGDVYFQLSASLHEKLRELAREHGATLFMVLQAGLAVLLTRLGAGTDIVVGSPIAGRSDDALNDLIGFFVNTLVLRTDTSGNPSFEKLLAGVRENDLNAYAHQDLPFEHLVEVLNPTRTLNRHPLFQVMLGLQNTGRAELELRELKVSLEASRASSAKFDLTFNLREELRGGEAQGIFGEINYAVDLFERGTVEKLAERLERVLRGVAENPGESIGGVEILGREEREQLLYEWNDTGVEFASGKCVHEMFEGQVEKTPEAVAVVYAEQQVSYGELNRRANQVAHYLRKLGVGPDVRVGLCVERSVEMVVGILGILKAGGAYVPLDPANPAERLRFMLVDSAPVALLTQSQLVELFEGLDLSLPVVGLDAPTPAWADLPDRNLRPGETGLDPENLAYVIYTSGSTGLPKGVLVQHSGFCNYLAWAIEEYAPAEGAIVSSPLSFDATVTSLWGALLCGGAIQLLRERQEIDGLLALIVSSEKPPLVKLTPGLLDVLAQQILSRGTHTFVRVLVVGGEPLSAETVRQWRQIQPGIRLINEYGPTETVVGCIAHDVPQNATHTHTIPIGRPIANARIYILDAEGEPVPVGVTGELYIGGAGVARGYMNRPELTAEKFIPHAFSGAGGERLYQTGDQVRWQADGELEFLGRLDDQVKLRGLRIELGEIEAALRKQAGVLQAVVVMREGQLIGYVVLEGGQPTTQELREKLRQQLPEYMVPAAIVVLASLPLTANGKLDRKALPAPEFTSVGSRSPSNLQEEILAFLFAEVLCLERVGIDDNFFSLGGHSLLATRLTSRIRSTFGVELAGRTLFEAPTVADLVQILRRADDERMTFQKESRDHLLPVSHDFSPWLLDPMNGPIPTDRVPLALRLQGRLNVPVLRQIFIDLVSRHEILHTFTEGFLAGDGVSEFFASREITEDQLGLAMQQASASGSHPGNGIPLQAWLFQLSEQEHVLMLVLHRVAINNPSIAPLIADVIGTYGARYPGEGLNWTPMPVETADLSGLVA